MTELEHIANIDPEIYLDALRAGNFSTDQLKKIQRANFISAEKCRRGADICERIAQGVGDIINGYMMGGENMDEQQQDAPETQETPTEAPEAPQTPQESPEEGGLDKSDDDS